MSNLTSDARDNLIASQQLEISALKENLELHRQALNKIHSSMVCIGGPLNDNVLKYDKKQLHQLSGFSRIIEDIL